MPQQQQKQEAEDQGMLCRVLGVLGGPLGMRCVGKTEDANNYYGIRSPVSSNCRGSLCLSKETPLESR